MCFEEEFTSEEKYLLGFVLPRASDDACPTTMPVESVLSAARQSGLDFAVLHAWNRKGQLGSVLKSRLKSLQSVEVWRQKTIIDLLELAERANLRLLPIKSFLEFPYVDHDLDVVAVDWERWKAYRPVLERGGYCRFWSTAAVREPGKWFYRPRHTKSLPGIQTHVHFHNAISWNGVPYLDAKKVYERVRSIRVLGQSVPAPSIEDELLTLAAHAVFENHCVAAWEAAQITRLIARYGEPDWEYVIETAVHHHWVAGLWLYLAVMQGLLNHVDASTCIPESVLTRIVPRIDDDLPEIRCRRQLPIRLSKSVVWWVYKQKLRQDFGKRPLLGFAWQLATYSVFDWIVPYLKKGKKWLHGQISK